MIRHLVQCSIDHPRWPLVICFSATMAWTLLLPSIKLETDGRTLFAPGSPALVYQAEVDKEFVGANYLIVGLASTGNGEIFTPPSLNWVYRVTDRVQALDGVAGDQVRSLSTVASPLWSDQGLRVTPPLQQEIGSQEAADAVRASIAGNALFNGVLVSGDNRSASIYAPLREGANRPAVYKTVRQISEEELARIGGSASSEWQVHLLGPAVAESLLGDHILRDLSLLLPLTILMVALILWCWFRSVTMVLVGLGEVVAMLTWSLGLMAALGRPVSLVTVVMPLLLATYCVVDTIHIGERFREKLAILQGQGRRVALKVTMDEVFRPVVFATLATVLGFLSFILTPIPPLRDFGFFTAFGVLCDLGVSLFVIPAALLVSRFGERSRRRAPYPMVALILEKGAVVAVRRPIVVLSAAVAVSLVFGAGMMRLGIQDSWIDNFSARSDIAASDRWFNQSFLGSNIVNAVFDLPDERGAYDADFIARLDRLQNRVGALKEVGGSLSLADYMKSVSRVLEGIGRLPSSHGEAEEWALMCQMSGGEQSLAPYVNEAAGKANVWIFVNRADYNRTASVIDAIQECARASNEGPALSVHFAGDAYRGRLLVGSITRTQIESLFVSLAVIFLLVRWMLRSTALAALSFLPVALAILWNFGFMGWIQMPLGVATSTFSAIALGLGVDFALHWLARMQLALEETQDWESAARLTGSITGGAILLNVAVLLLGFGILYLSSVPPNRWLGLLMGINLIACLATTLLVLPALATVSQRRLERGILLQLSNEMGQL